ncbi:MAG: hypothetical protein FRX49_04686 [Trebouxia sp. A1-2]|nr:MAG: hypothetical protein FRX49_04686 [Trebouxia sp. A1-2]
METNEDDMETCLGVLLELASEMADPVLTALELAGAAHGCAAQGGAVLRAALGAVLGAAPAVPWPAWGSNPPTSAARDAADLAGFTAPCRQIGVSLDSHSFISSPNPRTDFLSTPALAEAAAPQLELVFTPSPSLSAALAPEDKGKVLDRGNSLVTFAPVKAAIIEGSRTDYTTRLVSTTFTHDLHDQAKAGLHMRLQTLQLMTTVLTWVCQFIGLPQAVLLELASEMADPGPWIPVPKAFMKGLLAENPSKAMEGLARRAVGYNELRGI